MNKKGRSGKKPAAADMDCSVARTLEILGDRWIFLILREAFFGVRHYDDFLANLGIATNILAKRLRILVENGIMERRKETEDARRVRYRLTEKGLQGAFIGTRTVRGRKELCVCVGRFPSRNDRRAELLKEKVINLDRRKFTGRVEGVKLD